MPIFVTCGLIMVFVILYIITGGTLAVSVTQRLQFAIILLGMLCAAGVAYYFVSQHATFGETIQLAGHMGKLNIITTQFSWNDRFNIWSGLLASTFLFLSYFGTDQSQVSRYLGGQSITQSRLSLMMNGLLKIPMQFLILFIGVLVYVFYLFYPQPIFHNEKALNEWKEKDAVHYQEWQAKWEDNRKSKTAKVTELQKNIQHSLPVDKVKEEIKQVEKSGEQIRDSVKYYISKTTHQKADDRDYMFLNFVLHYLPHGLIGLLMAVIFSAAMSSLASELYALASTTSVDIYKRWFHPQGEPPLRVHRLFIALWAFIALLFSFIASQQNENLIQLVNIVGSLFYGTLLGVFLLAFYFSKVKGRATLIAAVVAECITLLVFIFLREHVAFLYFNIIGCIGTIALAIVIEKFSAKSIA